MASALFAVGSSMNHFYVNYFLVLIVIFLLQISLQAINSDVPEVALQGIEFWSNVCEEEITLSLEAEEVCLVIRCPPKDAHQTVFVLQAAENNRVPEQVSRHYAKGAVSHICPLMLQILTHQGEQASLAVWLRSCIRSVI